MRKLFNGKDENEPATANNEKSWLLEGLTSEQKEVKPKKKKKDIDPARWSYKRDGNPYGC